MAALWCQCGAGPFPSTMRLVAHELTHLSKKKGI